MGIAYEFDSTAKVGNFTVVGPGHRYLNLSTGVLSPIPAGAVHNAFGPVTLVGRGITSVTDTRKVGYVIGKRAAFMIIADGTFTPDVAADPLAVKTAVNAALDKARANVLAGTATAIDAAIAGARPK